MRVIAFNGSPHGENGVTHVMVREFLAGAAEAGAETEEVLLAGKAIGHCRGCFACWIATPGTCAINDDMAELLRAFDAADVVVLATPLYTDVVTGTMKDFMDRLIPLLDPHIVQDAEGESRHPLRYEKAPKIVILANCGFPEQSHFQVLSLLFKRFARNFHSEVIAEIYRGGGPLLLNQTPELQPLIASYSGLLRKAGREIAQNLRLSDDTMAALDRPLIPPEAYRQGGNMNGRRAFVKDEASFKVALMPGSLVSSSPVDRRVKFVRTCYWIGAVADLLAAAALLIPRAVAAIFALSAPPAGEAYLYASRASASLMLGWAFLLTWGSRRPVERKGVLLLTAVPVLAGLLVASVLAVRSGFVEVGAMFPLWIFYAVYMPLCVIAYAAAGSIERARSR